MSGKTVTLTIDGHKVQALAGTTIWEAARGAGVEIPVLCHSPRLTPVGVCRMCVVDLGERVMAASCVRVCEEGMEVRTDTPDLHRHRTTLTALLLSDYPETSARESTTGDDELLALARKLGVSEIPYPDGAGTITGGGTKGAGPKGRDDSSPVIAVDHQACILCDRCIRGCGELQHNDVIGRTGKGHGARIGFDLDTAMGQSTCVACGECAALCPTGALTDKSVSGLRLRRG